MLLVRLYKWFTLHRNGGSLCPEYTATLPLASTGIEGNVVYISSLSRQMAPLNLMAFVAGPHAFIQSLRGLYNSIYQRGDAILEQAVTDMMKADVIGQHARSSLKVYQNKRDIMEHCLDKYLNRHVTYNIPNAGLAFCLKLDPQQDLKIFRKKLISDGIWVPPYDLITFGGDVQNILRLGFASLSAHELERGIIEIASILK